MRVFLLRLQIDSPISMAKPSMMESTGEMVEGKVDNKILGPDYLCQDH